MDKDFLKVINEISGRLTAEKLRVSIAESCTGGFISNAITDMPGASKFYDAAIVCYSIGSKATVLDISGDRLQKFGSVSEETAVEMAESVRRIARTPISLSVTGVIGPEAEEGKEAGLIYMAVCYKDNVESRGIKLIGDSAKIKREASLEALKFLSRVLGIWL